MTSGNYIRFGFILVLWLLLCYLLLSRVRQVTFMTMFTVVASGIVVFVPLYKKYVRNKE